MFPIFVRPESVNRVARLILRENDTAVYSY